MTRKSKVVDEAYDEEILASYEREEWRSVPKLKEEIARYTSSAAATLVKEKRINIRLSSRDLEDIQMKAAEEGMPYQTLIASIIHKYVSGRLVEAAHQADLRVTASAKKMRGG